MFLSDSLPSEIRFRQAYTLSLYLSVMGRVSPVPNHTFHTYRFPYTEGYFRAAFQFLHTFHGLRSTYQNSTSLFFLKFDLLKTILTIRQNSLYVTVCMIARTFYQGYFIHSLSTLHYCNAPKPFRLAELYLIAIEAYVASGVQGGDQAASDLKNELKSNRIEGYTAKTYTAGELRSEVKDERVRELVGEGFRLSDLKRYGAGITRGEAQLSSVLSQPGQTSTELLSKTAEDYRFVWPIPTTETDANPKIKQNPGYTN